VLPSADDSSVWRTCIVFAPREPRSSPFYQNVFWNCPCEIQRDILHVFHSDARASSHSYVTYVDTGAQVRGKVVA